jgi:hypothetical protein
MRTQVFSIVMCLACSLWLACAAFAEGSAAKPAASEDEAETPGLKPYVAKKVPLPAKDAKYVLPDGLILIAGNDLMVPYMEKLTAMFRKSHPDFRFHMELHTSGLSVSGINSGKSALGPIARDISFQESDAFTSRHGYPPTDIQVGWDNTPDAEHVPPGKYPPGVWVNVKNPTPWLTMDDIAGIFTTGTGKGDYTFWGQLEGHEGPIGGNGADYSKREIHAYMPKLERLPILSTMRTVLGGAPWSHRIEHLPMMEDVINAVANDPFGIGLIGWWPTDEGWPPNSATRCALFRCPGTSMPGRRAAALAMSIRWPAVCASSSTRRQENRSTRGSRSSSRWPCPGKARS